MLQRLSLDPTLFLVNRPSDLGFKLSRNRWIHARRENHILIATRIDTGAAIMSVPLAASLTTLGCGLKDEDLDEIIVMEKMRDVSSRYSQALTIIRKRFSAGTRIRVIEFDRLSGVDSNTQAWLNALVDVNRHLSYSYIHSNRDCCSLFLYAGFKGKPKICRNDCFRTSLLIITNGRPNAFLSSNPRDVRKNSYLNLPIVMTSDLKKERSMSMKLCLMRAVIPH